MKETKKQLTKFMNILADIIGKPLVFAAVVTLTFGWFAMSIFLEYDVWYDIIDLAIFVSTFFLLFINQNSQNADTRAMQDKLDTIVDALSKADKDKEAEEKRIKRGDDE